MALGRMEAKVVSRGAGHSAVAKAAYNARETLTAERYGKTEDYSRKAEDCLFRGFYAPKGAPEWAQERGSFWNAVEWREKRKDAQLGREFEIALPHELTAEQNRWLLQDFVRENFTRRGYAADVAIHAASRDGDRRNIHAHVFVPLRRIEGAHWAEKKDRPSELDRKAELKELRDSWETLANRHLERHGFSARIDMRSYAEQGVDRTPGVHMGKEATGKERRGETTELGNRNREAANENARRAANQNQPSYEQIQEAWEHAAHARARSAPGKGERTIWDQSDGSTLSNLRQREREAEGGRGAEHEARRALDDLARTDPLGTARHFGHRLGDHLKTPEDLRREMAARMRGFAAESEAVRARPEPRQRDEINPKRDPADARAAWAARLRGMAEAGPQKPARGPDPVQARHAPAAERERPATSYLRSALTAARERLDALGGRFDATLTLIQARLRDREATAVSQARAKAAPEPSFADPTRSRGAPSAEQPTRVGRAREDTSSRKANRDLAEEVLDEARRKLAQEAAVDRGKAHEHDRQEREREGREYGRVREILRQEQRARRPHEPN